MAFPIVQSIGVSVESANTNSHTVSMASGVSSGDLILLLIIMDGARDFEAGTIDDYTLILRTNRGSDNSNRCYFKVADGSEATFEITLTVGNVERSIIYALRISGAHASTAPEAAGAQDFFTPADSPVLSPSWGGAEDVLWVISSSYEDTTGAGYIINGYPTNYSSNQHDNNTGPADEKPQGVMATRTAAAGSENPAAWPDNASGNSARWAAHTIAVRPAAAGAVLPVFMNQYRQRMA